MGDAADMMVNGLLCEACGAFLDGEEPGYPRYCSRQCAEDRGAPWAAPKAKRPRVHRGPYVRRVRRG